MLWSIYVYMQLCLHCCHGSTRCNFTLLAKCRPIWLQPCVRGLWKQAYCIGKAMQGKARPWQWPGMMYTTSAKGCSFCRLKLLGKSMVLRTAWCRRNCRQTLKAACEQGNTMAAAEPRACLLRRACCSMKVSNSAWYENLLTFQNSWTY